VNSSQPALFPVIASSGFEHIAEAGIADILFDAYRQGRSAPRMTPKSDWKAGWQQRLKARTHCSLQDQFILLRSTQLAAKARSSAASGDIATACQLFGLAHSLISSKDLGHEGRLRCTLEVAAAEAYMDYFCGDFEQARTKLFDSLFAAQELEDRFGYDLFHIHRIHLLNNLVKVEARANRLSGALELAANIILYLQGKQSGLPVPGSWGSGYYKTMRNEDLQFLSGQLVNEIAAATVGIGSQALRPAFKVLAERVDLNVSHTSWQPEAYTWLQLKALREMSEGHLDYQQRCLPYLAAGPGASILLWHFTAFDVANTSETYGEHRASFFKREVLTDLQRIQALPRHVRAFVDRALATCVRDDRDSA
jgi:hypothetical protein